MSKKINTQITILCDLLCYIYFIFHCFFFRSVMYKHVHLKIVRRFAIKMALVATYIAAKIDTSDTTKLSLARKELINFNSATANISFRNQPNHNLRSPQHLITKITKKEGNSAFSQRASEQLQQQLQLSHSNSRLKLFHHHQILTSTHK